MTDDKKKATLIGFVAVVTIGAAVLVTSGGSDDGGDKILLIQGIGSKSTCEDSTEFIKKTSWLTDALSRAPEISSGDFLYYAYTSRDPDVSTCVDKKTPKYSKKDSCWSIDDVYKRPQLFNKPANVPFGGQAKRLARYLKDYFDHNPGNLSIIAHSQGGVLATYTVLEELSDPNEKGEDYRERITAIITLDSPLGGINWLFAEPLRVSATCVGDLQFDSSFDMKPKNAVISRITNNQNDTPPTKLYTVNAYPGGQCLEISKILNKILKKLKILKIPEIPNIEGCTWFSLIDNDHSDLKWWSNNGEQHIEVDAQTHSDIWEGCFVSRSICDDDSSTTELGAAGARLIRFISCAVSNQSDSNCKMLAGSP